MSKKRVGSSLQVGTFLLTPLSRLWLLKFMKVTTYMNKTLSPSAKCSNI